jgi:hypothetical protein
MLRTACSSTLCALPVPQVLSNMPQGSNRDGEELGDPAWGEVYVSGPEYPVDG